MLSARDPTRRIYKSRSMCPAVYCKADDPVQALVDQSQADGLGHPELAGGIHCTDCGSVWFDECEQKRIVGRFAGPINARGWMPLGA